MTHPNGSADHWIVQLNEDGNLIGDFLFGGVDYEGYARISAAPFGGLMPGFSRSPISGNVSEPSKGDQDAWVIRFDENGNKIWDRRFGSSGRDYAKHAATAPDGGFLIACESSGPASFDQRHEPFGSTDFWLIRTDENGDSLWTRRFGGDAPEFLWYVAWVPDGGWIAVGSTDSRKSGTISQEPKAFIPAPDAFPNIDAWLVRFDDQGQLLWERRYGSYGSEQFQKVLPLHEGGFLAVGKTNSLDRGDRMAASGNGETGWLVKIDADGNFVQDWVFGSAGGGTTINDIVLLPQGGCLLACETLDAGANGMRSEPSRGGRDGWAIQLDAGFNIVWEKTFGGSLDDSFASAANGRDGVVYLSGYTKSPADPPQAASERRSPHRGGSWNLWFLKLVPDEPMSLRETHIKGYRLEQSARITFAPQPLEVIDILVERTQDLSSRPVRFQTIAQIETGQVCGTAECQWLDREPLPGNNFYRIVYRMADGSRVYSNIVQLTFESHQSPEVIDFRIYPNPTQGPVHLDFQSRLAGQARLELFSTDGRAVHTQTLHLERGANAFDLELDLPTGVYLMRVSLPDGTTVRERMLVR